MINLSDKILGTIKKNKIEPIAKWRFWLKNFALWGGVFIFFLLGLFGATFLFYFTQNLEIFDFILESPQIILKTAIIAVPLLWIFCILCFSFFVGFSLSNTKRGYKYPLLWLFVAGILIQLGGGAVLANTQAAQKITERIENGLPFFKPFINQREKAWNRPEEGFLAGKVLEVYDDTFLLQDFEGDTWTIEKDDHMKENNLPKVDNKLRMHGRITGDNMFAFDSFRPLHREKKREFLGDPKEETEEMKARRREMMETGGARLPRPSTKPPRPSDLPNKKIEESQDAEEAEEEKK